MPIPDEDKLRHFDTVFMRMIGREHGQQVAEMLVQYHIENRPYLEIAKIHGIPYRTVLDRLKRACEEIKACGLWRPEWDRPCRKSKSTSIIAIRVNSSIS